MRTPGDDFDLVPGFRVAEGAVARAEDVVAMRYCPGATDDGATTYNVIDVIPAPGVVPPALRAQLTTSACGVCGTASIDLVRARTRWPVNADPVEVAPATLAGLPETLRATQQVFERTGGLHAAALFMANGVLVCLREDVGRHNAADKMIGAMLRADRLPLAGHVLLVSGRVVRARTEGPGGRHPCSRRGVGALEPRGRPGARRRHDPGGVPARSLHECVCRIRADRSGGPQPRGSVTAHFSDAPERARSSFSLTSACVTPSL